MAIRNPGTVAAALLLVTALALPSLVRADDVFRIGEIAEPAALGGTITVPINDLAKWSDDKHPLCKAVLYLADQQLKGMYPRDCHSPNTLTFDLKRGELKGPWATILGAPDGLIRKVTVAVGFEDGSMLVSGGSVELTLIRTDWVFWVFTSLFIVAVILFFFLAFESDILRDDELPPGAGARKTFSLGRCQMAWWFFLVLAAYVLIWIVTGDRDSLSSSALALLGISSATALGATIIDASKRIDTQGQLRALKQEEVSLNDRIAEIRMKGSQAKASDDEKRELAEKNARLSQINSSITQQSLSIAPMKSEGFLRDILTDASGVSLHRFQIVVWTIVLGFIFAISVYNTLGMPEFSGTLLALMGISNGTYIGFKFPERQV